jgi:NADPH:quinone reductase-like Zn-dependent oxidoreductase
MQGRRIVWRLSRAGSLDRLGCSEEPLPAPGAGEAQIAVRAIGLNFADVCACLGLYSATPAGPFVPGLELAGVVEALGPPRAGEVPALALGDGVMALTRFGGYTTRLNADVRYLRRIPPGWSFAEAAAFPVQALTAWYGLVRLGGAHRGSVVLVQSAAGGVGLQALALLQRLGAHPVAVVGQPAKIAFLGERRALPRARCVLRGAGDFAAQLDAALGNLGAAGFDLVFDAVLGDGFQPAFDRLAPEGRYLLYGAADFVRPGARRAWPHLAWRWLRRPRLDPLALISSNRAVFGFNLIWLWQRSERLPEAYAELEALRLEPPWIGARHPFAAARTALAELQSGATVGKTILYVDDPG